MEDNIPYFNSAMSDSKRNANLSDAWLGKLLGEQQRYQLEQPLGNGAIGDVYLTTDIRLGRRVAIKVLKGTLARSKELLLRFEREIAILAALESEHVVQVLDYGLTSEGYPFYVMEYLKGQTLSQLMGRSRRLSVDLTVRIATQICEGLRVAHEGVMIRKVGITESKPVKVIHRDLKPANIFLVPTAVGALVKVLDFGIAKKLYTSETAEHTNLTQAFLGTYHYASPEQLQNARKLDERADIYSLGLILYEMLSGTDPFGIVNNRQTKQETAWAMAHASTLPTPLRQQSGCEQLPELLEAIIMRCLCKSVDERFSSMAELSHALSVITQVNAARVADSATSAAANTTTDDDLTVLRPKIPQDPTAHRPITAAAPLTPAVTPSMPIGLPDRTIAQSSLDQVFDKTIVQTGSMPLSSPHRTPDRKLDRTVAQTPGSQPVSANTTVFQKTPSTTPPTTSSMATNLEGTIAQAPRPASPNATLFQSPAKSSAIDRTKVQTSSSTRADVTLAQSPSASPFSRRVDQTQVQTPKSRQNAIQGSLPSISQTQSISAWLQAPLRLLLQNMLPISFGFGAGLILMVGMFLYQQFQAKQNAAPTSRSPVPTVKVLDS